MSSIRTDPHTMQGGFLKASLQLFMSNSQAQIEFGELKTSDLQ